MIERKMQDDFERILWNAQIDLSVDKDVWINYTHSLFYIFQYLLQQQHY